MIDPKNHWKDVRKTARQFRGSIGVSSLSLRVGVGVFFLLVLGPLILSGLLALVIAVACSIVVMLVQRVLGLFSEIFSPRDHQGRKNVKVVRRN